MPDEMKDIQPVSLYQSDNSLMNDAIDRLVAKLYSFKSRYQKSSILLTGSASGNGTTTVAINLAIALASSGWNTLLVDADMRKNTEFKRLGSDVAGLSDYLEGEADMDSIIGPTSEKNLFFVQCGQTRANAVRLLSSKAMQDFVTAAGSRYDFVVFDCPSVTVVPDATVLFPAVDCIALVLALNDVTKKQLEHARQELANYQDKYAGLIVNRVDKRQYIGAFPQHDYFEEKNIRKAYNRGLNKNRKDKG